ncbi:MULTISPECIES: tautomerase family protein [unclassified Novosphingobium]|uniref:tautomerase family protein n=1 Tax=unclassified Novosphingobium TaxID=2644732 RepID=UPI001494AC19|nr:MULTISPECIES: tautomerase family protein [unclassified Novosphingobium]MBB3356918.1 phenylpyruvate tautomerase PptA (4-oxalocrotonate tautomerase family) [Novosphingobium sp. BK256]MBB3373319.1 phenylpyruvate tautomerase PptA (4-oxalocrotonate tautomerase family) [Novosphingobium sp. BK280]MBB3377688.1 phenylpyruvate tautomerase PptA (4-oxalocrotonate tautomerase family) [Novosphingobium sp. BK258]MBB3418901.1 phenylpyruvate tautomerase PptA (4-oxalocrotonate tautomerase family) [Novosphingo
MPLVHVSLRHGKPAPYRKAILNGIYEALRRTFDVPEDDRFLALSEHSPDDFVYGAHYLGVARSDDLLLVQITVTNKRTIEQKKALYRQIVANLADDPGVRPEDVFINLVEVKAENWSLGNGLAQYADPIS